MHCANSRMVCIELVESRLEVGGRDLPLGLGLKERQLGLLGHDARAGEQEHESYANFRRARARAKEKIAVKSLHTRESGLSGADRNSQKNDLLLTNDFFLFFFGRGRTLSPAQHA